MHEFEKIEYQGNSYYIFHIQSAGTYEIFKVYSGNVTKTLTIPSTYSKEDARNCIFSRIKETVTNKIS